MLFRESVQSPASHITQTTTTYQHTITTMLVKQQHARLGQDLDGISEIPYVVRVEDGLAAQAAVGG